MFKFIYIRPQLWSLLAATKELVPTALQALEKGGTLAVAGIYLTPIPNLDYVRELFGERVLRSVTANTKQDGLDLLREAVRSSRLSDFP